MLLDAVNTPFSDQGYARRQMLSFVQKQYKPGEKMAIFTLTASAGQLLTSAASGTPSAGSVSSAIAPSGRGSGADETREYSPGVSGRRRDRQSDPQSLPDEVR